MSKNIYFLLSIIALLALVVGLIFYDFNSYDKSDFSNITFRNENVIINRGVSSRNTTSSDFSNLNFNQTSSSRKIKVRKYHVKTDLQAANTNSSYVSGDLSMMSNSVPRVSLNVNAFAGYRRYVSDNSASQMIMGVSTPQTLKINFNSSHSHSHAVGGVVQTGPMMAASCDHIFDPLNPGECGNGCGAIPTFPNGWGDGITEDTEIEWVPIGDIMYPMLLLAVMYMIFVYMHRRSI